MSARRILFANLALSPRTGTVMYVRDLALALAARGHAPALLAGTDGDVADELRAAGIPVSHRIRDLGERPDVIHGNHWSPTLVALGAWPGVPAISVCHAHAGGRWRTPRHARIRRWFGVSRVCVERIVRDGIHPDRAEYLLNFVDTARFTSRSPLPSRPRRALVFSNFASEQTQLPAVRAACAAAGLSMDVIGDGVGRAIARPEERLAEYDVVFAKAKAALEAMAVGCAVVLCDFAGVGPMVSGANFDRLRLLNFGFEALSQPLDAAAIVTELARYDAADAARVRDRVRAETTLNSYVDGLLSIYEDVIARPGDAPRDDTLLDAARVAGATVTFHSFRTWRRIPASSRRAVRDNPIARSLRDAAGTLVGLS